VAELAEAICRDPGLPLALVCRSDDSFAFQSPADDGDDAQTACFRQKQDMEILFRMDLTPGVVLPARIAVARARKAVPSVSGVCTYGDVSGPAWKGCPLAGTGLYERLRETMLERVFAAREEVEMAEDKATTLTEMLEDGPVRIRPHILLCAVAQYGRGIRPPFDEDNLPELLQLILKEPDAEIELTGGADAMMCAPCPCRCPDRGICIGPGHIHSGGLMNELKDLRILQILGLVFGDTLPAKELYTRIFTRIPTTVGSCAIEQAVPELSAWWDPCPCGGYERGRRELMVEMGIVQGNVAV
jgi:hypothetical protein